MSRSCASSTSRKRSCDRRTAGPIFARSVRPVTVTRSCFVRLSLSRHSRLMSPLLSSRSSTAPTVERSKATNEARRVASMSAFAAMTSSAAY